MRTGGGIITDNEINITNVKTADYKHVDINQREGHKLIEGNRPYAFDRFMARPIEPSAKISAGFYRLEPGFSNYPYHYHSTSEEIFYIVSGRGILETPAGNREVTEGDLIVMPAGENGAHMLTNTSQSILVYIDIGSEKELDAAFYPKSGKIGIYGDGLRKIFKLANAVGYLDGE